MVPNDGDRRFYRVTRSGSDGRPLCGPSGAVTPDDPKRLPEEFRPESLGGIGRGNQVRSFLDITTRDDTTNSQVEHDVTLCIDLIENRPFPLDLHSRDTTFQFNLELALAPAWRRELLVLLHRALDVRV